VNFTGSNIFHGNNGSSLKVVSTIIHLSGELQFINNSGGKESALYMQSFSQVVLHRGLSIIFEGNSGRFGASILVESITTSTVYSQLAGNPQCPFLYEDPDLSPLNWTNVTTEFANNTAILGSATTYLNLMPAHGTVGAHLLSIAPFWLTGPFGILKLQMRTLATQLQNQSRWTTLRQCRP
jgi:hypothetical protein